MHFIIICHILFAETNEHNAKWYRHEKKLLKQAWIIQHDIQTTAMQDRTANCDGRELSLVEEETISFRKF